jgi:hypothetical protein
VNDTVIAVFKVHANPTHLQEMKCLFEMISALTAFDLYTEFI